MKKPNIVLIMTDQQRGDALSLAGHPVLSTPNMDALAGQGVYFPHAYSEVPSCIAARRIALTGLNQQQTGLVGYLDHQEWNPSNTLPGMLKSAGYQTHLVGKLHMWPRRKRYGFDSMKWSDGPYWSSKGSVENDYQIFLRKKGFTESWMENAHGVETNSWMARPSHLEERFTFTNWIVEEALEFLTTRDPSSPFFLNLGFFAPHPPYTPPEIYFSRYMDMDLPGPSIGDWVDGSSIPRFGVDAPKVSMGKIRLDQTHLKRAMAGYYGSITHVDDQIGRLMFSLRALDLLKDTVILFTSDHGEMLGDHHCHMKCCPYEGSSRIPMIIQPPEWMEFSKGSRREEVMGLQDICPTLLDMAGVPIPSEVSGRSALPLIRGQKVDWREVIHGEHTKAQSNLQGMHYLTNGREKYIWYVRTGEEQFFDLTKDPGEKKDLSKDPGSSTRVDWFRKELIRTLRDRPEGFTSGNQLVSGREYEKLIPSKRDLLS